MAKDKDSMVKIKAVGPEQISFDITSNCNLKCVHCFNDSGNSAPLKDLEKEEKLRIAREIGLFHPINVCLCGGETTCCPFLFEIIDTLKPEVGKISMVSNGYLMTPELAEKLKEHGVGMTQVSIDGAFEWQHDSFRGVKDSYVRAVNAVKYLKAAGIESIDLSLVPNRLNYKSMAEYSEMAISLGADRIRMMPFLPSGRGAGVGRNLMLNEEEYFEFCRSISLLEEKNKGRLIYQWGDPIDHMRRMPANAEYGMTSYMMEVKTNGDLTFTTYLPVTAGNCKNHSLQEYWEAGYKNIWGDKRFTQYSDKIRNIYDLDEFEPQPYTGEMIKIDLMEDRI